MGAARVWRTEPHDEIRRREEHREADGRKREFVQQHVPLERSHVQLGTGSSEKFAGVVTSGAATSSDTRRKPCCAP